MEVTAIDRDGADAAEPRRESADREPGPDEGTERDPASDDGVILDEEGNAAERSPREWPDRPEHEQVDDGGDPGPWPETARPDDETPPEDRFVGPDDDQGAGGPGEGHAERGGDDGPPAAEDDPAARGQDGGSTGRDDGPPAADDAQRSSGYRDADPAGTDDGGEIIDADPDDADQSGDDDPGRVDVPQAESDASADAGAGATGGDRSPDAAGDADADRRAGDAAPDEPAAMGPDATQRPDDDAEVLETTEPNEQSRATAADPVDPTDHVPDGEPGDDAAPVGDDDRGGPSLDPAEAQSGERAPEDVEYYCPECGFLDDSDWPSRRAGDICPDCRRSYLAEREV